MGKGLFARVKGVVNGVLVVVFYVHGTGWISLNVQDTLMNFCESFISEEEWVASTSTHK